MPPPAGPHTTVGIPAASHSADSIQRGQSLQAYLFDVISDEARRQDNLAVLSRFAKGSHGTRLTPDDIGSALQAGRAERDAELGGTAASG